MSTTPRFLRRVGALCLAAALTLGVSALAAEPAAPAPLTEKAQTEDLNFFYGQLKKLHPDLFANTTEAEFLTRKTEIETRLPVDNAFGFALELQSLVTLVEDSHTSLSYGKTTQLVRFYPMAVTRFGDNWYLSAVESNRKDLLGHQVTAINGKSMEQVLAAFSKIVSADNPVKLQRNYTQMCNVADAYEYLGLVEKDAAMTLTLRDAKGVETKLEIRSISSEAMETVDVVTLGKQAAKPATRYNSATDSSQYYFSRILDKNTYYIQYNRCMPDPELPMDTFAKQVEKDLSGGAYQRVIVDLRNNGGGSDGVIFPILTVLRQQMDKTGIELVGLIGEDTFSSAIINAVELQEMGAVLVGEPTSGSVDHFGAVRTFQLPNSGLTAQYSTKYIDMGTLFDAAIGKGVESLAPDIATPQTVAGFLAGKDAALDYLLSHKDPLTRNARLDAPLTRGHFMGQLYQAAGSPAVSLENFPFEDAFGIEWYLPALAWSAQNDISKGTSATIFSAARPLSWQEAAVFAVRTADTLKLEPVTQRDGPSGLLCTARTREAVEEAWSWGLLEGADQDLSKPMTRSQGALLIQTLFK